MNRAIATTLLVASFLIGLSVAAKAQDSAKAGARVRPSTQGITLAYPHMNSVALPNSIQQSLDYEQRVPVTLTVSPEGKVVKASTDFVGDSLIAPKIDSVLKTLTFEPGLRDNKPVEQIVPVNCLVGPNSHLAILEFPVSDSLNVKSATLYRDALIANGLETPLISRFPPYFCPLPNHDSKSPLRSALFKVSVGRDGRAKAVDPIRSDLPDCAELLRSAANWATYNVDRKSGSKNLTDFYLSFVLHPAAPYPSALLDLGKGDSRRPDEKFLLQLFPDTLGVMTPPLPKRFGCDSVVIGDATHKILGRVVVAVYVDSTGTSQIARASRNERDTRRLLTQALNDYPFYPALTFGGVPVSFLGLLYLDFDGSANVRVHVDWLTDRSSPPIR